MTGRIVAFIYGCACYAITMATFLVLVFALQHSGMARPGFKKVWTRLVPKSVERSTYCLVSAAATLLIVFFWQPMGGVVWSIIDPSGIAIAYGVYALGWLFLVATTFMINHFDLFGPRRR